MDRGSFMLPSPDDLSRRWTRVSDRNGFDRILRWIGFASMSAACLLAVVLALDSSTGISGSLSVLAFIGAPAAYCMVFLLRRGLRVSRWGIEIVNPFSIRRVPWSEVRGFAVLPTRTLIGQESLEALTALTAGERLPVHAIRVRRAASASTARSPALTSRADAMKLCEKLTNLMTQIVGQGC